MVASFSAGHMFLRIIQGSMILLHGIPWEVRLGRAGSEQQQERGADRGGEGKVACWELGRNREVSQILKCYHLWCSQLTSDHEDVLVSASSFLGVTKSWHHILGGVNYPKAQKKTV